LKNNNEKASKDKGKKRDDNYKDKVNVIFTDFLLVEEFESVNLVDSSIN